MRVVAKPREAKLIGGFNTLLSWQGLAFLLLFPRFDLFIWFQISDAVGVSASDRAIIVEQLLNDYPALFE